MVTTKLELILGSATFVIGWFALFEWLRYRSWVKTRDSGFSPGTQHLVFLQMFGVLMGVIGILAVLISER